MAFTLTAGGTANIGVVGPPALSQVICLEASQKITYLYQDGSTVIVTGQDALDAIAGMKWLMSQHAGISDHVRL